MLSDFATVSGTVLMKLCSDRVETIGKHSGDERADIVCQKSVSRCLRLWTLQHGPPELPWSFRRRRRAVEAVEGM